MMTPHSEEGVAAWLSLWAHQPGSGRALVSYPCASARDTAIAHLKATHSEPVTRLPFANLGDLEQLVQYLADESVETPQGLVLISSFDDAFPSPELRARALELLTDQRDRIAQFGGKQAWWFGEETKDLLREHTPDLHAMFRPRLQIGPATDSVIAADEYHAPDLPLETAMESLKDARERITRAVGKLPTKEIWRTLACPALTNLNRAGAALQTAKVWAEFRDQIYGPKQDASRAERLREDRDAFLRENSYSAVFSLTGNPPNLLVPPATPHYRRLLNQHFGHKCLHSRNWKAAVKIFRPLREELGKLNDFDQARLLELAGVTLSLAIALSNHDSAEELDEALHLLRIEAIPLFDTLRDPERKADALGTVANIFKKRGDFDEAIRIRREEQLPFYERQGDLTMQSSTLSEIADIYQQRGATDEAIRIRREEQLPIWARHGDLREHARTLGKIADIFQQRGDTDEAIRIRHDEQLPVLERAGDLREYAVTLGKIASIFHQRGDRDEALRILTEQSLPALMALESRQQVSDQRFHCALIRLEQGRWEKGEAQTICDELSESFTYKGGQGAECDIVAGFALLEQLRATCGQHTDALQVMTLAADAFETLGRLDRATALRNLHQRMQQAPKISRQLEEHP